MLKPLRTNIVVKPVEVSKTNSLGLIIANSIQNQGVVEAIGIDVKQIAVGQTVIYDKTSVVDVNGQLMCREEDVYCIVEG